ncbi:serine/threonine-protein kinase [Streptomyces sp. P9(2023)]|uniref:serine/threonine-protein kinase n=1 Tax=Streptomyces sp. P9(2023) TaxID=3064394 RepID=UPI0028F44AF5|nr:serine/threonine-protein kinase [Streptomyces sp. P9(2023)]MDT9690848.1 serine/threonine-protein kinase [Streptomyces sp. P9(2023)]
MGEVFAGRYELIDPIGRGGVGAVWRAWDHRRRRYVAAKVLQQSDAHTLLRFVREQALRIDHPHVLAPASWAADDDKVLFTMDLVAGGSLAHVIGDYGPLPPRFVCTLLDQLLSGLAAVHAEGVVHRDIKPANILLDVTGTGRPHLRLSDFGISMRKGEPRLTETNYVVGTPGYFAPEQMLGAEPDFPADLFAVGLVALYLLRGQKPDSRALIEYFMTHGTPGAPEGIPEPLWQILAGLLQPDPQARFKTATGVRKALTTAVEMLPEPRPGEEPVEVFDQIGPLPAGFGPNGPETPAPKAPAPAPAPQDTAPQAPAVPVDVPPQPQQPVPSPSETGSFHLPPPPPQPVVAASTPPQGLAQAPTAGVSYPPASTRQYTAQAGQVPAQAAPSAPASASAPARRPGPPPKVAIPVLFVALICFAVGIWALTQA